MTDTNTGCTFIHSEEAAIRFARMEAPRLTIRDGDIQTALYLLNANKRGEVWQQDTKYLEGMRNV